MALGENIKEAREAKGWSRLRLADECGVHPVTIETWERNEVVPKEIIVKGLENVLKAKLKEE